LTLGQEFSGYSQQIINGIRRVESTLPWLYELAAGSSCQLLLTRSFAATEIALHVDVGAHSLSL